MHSSLDLPELVNQRLVKPLIEQVSIAEMRSNLENLTSYYTRYFGSTTGEQSAQWIHGQVAEVRKPLVPQDAPHSPVSRRRRLMSV